MSRKVVYCPCGSRAEETIVKGFYACTDPREPEPGMKHGEIRLRKPLPLEQPKRKRKA